MKTNGGPGGSMTASDDVADGGQAFPAVIHSLHVKGMSLRDYFAGQVIHAMLSGRVGPSFHTNGFINVEDAATAASNAYAIADAMIAERNKS